MFAPPRQLPVDPAERARIEHTQARVRVVSGRWEPDLQTEIVGRVGEARAKAWGAQRPISNPLADLSELVSTLYTRRPSLSHPDSETNPDVARFVARLDASGLWVTLRRAQRMAEALNEVAVWVDLSEDGALSWRIVTPDWLDGVSRAGRPGVPAILAETRLRSFKTERGVELVWVRDEYDVTDPKAPVHRVLRLDDNRDVTASVYFDQDGAPARVSAEGYRYVHQAGRAFIPAQLYHASGAPLDLFEPYERVETFNLTLANGVLIASQDHGAVHASHPQRWVANGAPVTKKPVRAGADEAQVVDADATTILQFQSEEGQQFAAGQWDTAAPLADVQALIESRLRTAAARWGIPAAELERKGGDPRSGLALVLSEEGRRKVQEARAPIYAPQDVALIGKAAALVKRAGLLDVPDTGWVIEYGFPAPTETEQVSRVDRAVAALDARLVSRIEARQIITGETAQAAKAALAAIDAEQPLAPPPAA